MILPDCLCAILDHSCLIFFTLPGKILNEKTRNYIAEPLITILSKFFSAIVSSPETRIIFRLILLPICMVKQFCHSMLIIDDS